MDEKRRHRRFEFHGSALVVVEHTPDGPVLILTNYRDISQGGASVISPDAGQGEVNPLSTGGQVRLTSGESERDREAEIVKLGEGRLHLRLKGADELTEFELVKLLESVSSDSEE